jgi:sRNA-binding protein
MLNQHRATRDESEQVIRMLCEHYPKCFFENPRLRRPLKKDIVFDLQKDKSFDVAPEMIDLAVDWYKSHIGYIIASSTAGAKRIDLNGKEVGTITENEAIAAQQEVDRINKSKINQQRSPVDVLNRMRATGRATDDGVKKLDATPIKSKATQHIAPEFIQLHETFANANAAVVNINDSAMRLAVAKATLDEVIKKAEQVKAELGGASQ